MHTHATTNSRSGRPFLTAAASALALTALVGPVPSNAGVIDNGADGVTADIKDGVLVVKGDRRRNAIALRLQSGHPTRLEVDVGDDGSGDFSFARKRLSAITVKTAGGNDSVRVDDANSAFTNSVPTTIAGGEGDDALNGGLGAEAFRGGPGKDRVDGGIGNDDASLGDGSDAFIWDPGDGSDDIDGQGGRDTMVFNGAVGAETVTMTAAGRRLVFARQPANIVMVTINVESVAFNALGGADTITVNDLTRTDVTETNLDLAETLGGGDGDAVVDSVVVNATNGDDEISVDGNGQGAEVTGLATAVDITHADTTDKLNVNTLAGTDNVLTKDVDGVLVVQVDSPA